MEVTFQLAVKASSSCMESLQNLQFLPVGQVLGVMVEVVETGHPGAISLSDTCALFRSWSHISRLTVLNWPSDTALRAMGPVVTTVPHLVVCSSITRDILDVSSSWGSISSKASSSANQDLLIMSAPHVHKLHVGSQVQIMTVSDAKRLRSRST